ncbi:dihydrofolate reductase family protein [soil metagenome]
MGRMLYSVTMSLDGFIAGPGGDMGWLAEFISDEPDPLVDQLIADTGALLVGRTTFGGDDPNKGTDGEGKAFGGGWDGPQFVLTHHAPDESIPGITYVGDIDGAIELSTAAAGDKFVNILGADTARQVLQAGALDEVVVFIVGVLLGDGVRLFDHPGGTQVRLERIDSHQTEMATGLRFRVLH